MIVYLSGPITNDPDFEKKFDAAAEDLIRQGHAVINPAKLNHVATDGVLDYEAYMSIDQLLLSKAEVICLLPGWKESPGCNRELGYAEALGLTAIKYESLRSKE